MIQILFLIVFILFTVLSSAQGNSAFEISSVEGSNEHVLPKEYHFMIADFLRARGEGRSYFISSSQKEIGGFYFAVDKLPPSISNSGKSLMTRDSKVLDILKKLQNEGVSIFLDSIDHKIDAQVWGDDELGQSLRKQGFPNSKNKYLLVVSPSATADILIHEIAHIEHKKVSHPISVFLEKYKQNLSGSQFKKIKRSLTELAAYQEQFLYLEKMKSSGQKSTYRLAHDPNGGHHVEVVSVQDLVKDRLEEIRASSSLYMSGISSILRDLDSFTRCALLDITRDSIKGMGSIETDLISDFLIQRCG